MRRQEPPDIIYLSWSRLHRPNASLIQTLHTTAGFAQEGLRVHVYLPPWSNQVVVSECLGSMGITDSVDLRASRLLHRRWGGAFFIRWYSRLLRAGSVIYTRVPQLSLRLARAGLRHHLEIHDTAQLERRHQLDDIVAYHRAGVIGQLIPISRTAAQVLVERGAEENRIHIAPSGFDATLFANVPSLEAARLAQPRLTYIGRISRDRGLRILEALAQCGRYQVTLVGPQDEAPSCALDIRPPVLHRQVPSWYAQTEIALMPYQADLGHALSISPIKLFEAMAAGRPVVVSDLKPIREIIRHGENGLLVEAADPQAWIAAIERLRTDPELALRLVDNARRSVHTYSWRMRAQGIARAIGLL